MTSIAEQLKSKVTSNRNGDTSARDLSDRYESRKHDRRQGNGFNRNEDRGQQRRPQRRDPSWGLLVDGVDHLNLWSAAKTTLGRFLAIEHAHFLKVRKYGEFSSILALYAFLTTRGHPARLRRAPTKALIDWISQRRNTDLEIDFPNVEYICAEAIAEVVRNAPNIQESLINTGEYPIVAYREASTYRRSTRRDEFWATVIRLIRVQLQAQQPLDMSSFYVGEGDASNAYVDLIRDNAILGEVKGMDDTKPTPRKADQAKAQKQPRRDEGRYSKPQDVAAPVYHLVFASLQLREQGLEWIQNLTNDDRLGFFASVSPRTDVEVTPPLGADVSEGYLYRLILAVSASGELGEISTEYLGEGQSPKVQQFAEGEPEATFTPVLKADGSPMKLSDLIENGIPEELKAQLGDDVSDLSSVLQAPLNTGLANPADFNGDQINNGIPVGLGENEPTLGELDSGIVSTEDLENENFQGNTEEQNITQALEGAGNREALQSTGLTESDIQDAIRTGEVLTVGTTPDPISGTDDVALVEEMSDELSVGTNGAYEEAEAQEASPPVSASAASLQSLQQHFGK